MCLAFLFLIPLPLFALEKAAVSTIGYTHEQPASESAVLKDEHAGEAMQQSPGHPQDALLPDPNSEGAAVTPYATNPLAVKAVDRNLALFAERIRERFALWLSRSGRYLDMMKEILKTKNVPEEIAFLPLIESGFNPSAYSVARAVGQWQFIASTAKRYGLTIDWWRDERRDPVKSTVAAAGYLRDLYDMFGSWNLAMAAYNAGEGKILRALNRTKSDDYWALLRTGYIKRETKEYVPRFIAAQMIATNPQAYGFENIDYHSPFAYDEVILTKPLDLDVAANCAGTTVEAIKDLNPELKRWCTPLNVSSYALRIPAGKGELFWENLVKLPEEEWSTVETYTVRNGDTIKKIAAKTGTPVSMIREFNGDLEPLIAGERIYLPPKTHKVTHDRDDSTIKKAKSKSRIAKDRKTKAKKIVVAALSKKEIYPD